MKFITARVAFFTIFISLFSLFDIHAQEGILPKCDFDTIEATIKVEPQAIHEITLYVMPTLFPLDWSSPASLYNSMKECYIKTTNVSDNYLLGHLAVKINSPLLPAPLLFAMTAANKWERINLVLKKKIGFGIMGYPLEGKFEAEQQLNKRLAIYAKRNKLAFITYRINETAAKRMIEFIKGMSKMKEDNKAACYYYGGAFWPRYENEGSGCSAMGMALLDVANLLPPESNEWLVKVNIPMNIIGGELNNNKKIRNSSIRKTKTWYEGEGVANVDYVYYQVYEPSIIFDWIIRNRQHPLPGFISVDDKGVLGLYVDFSEKPVNDNEPLFVKRTKPDKFIDHYYMKRGSSIQSSILPVDSL